MKRFSVIIPVYNAEKTLHRCLDSLLCQNRGQAEIILVNDGSKDRSGEICQEYARKNDCIVYIEQKNAGASSARNTGLGAASGTYVTFVDSDDYVIDGYFDALDGLDEDFIVFSYRMVRTDGMQGYQFSQALVNASSHIERVMTVLKDRIAGPVNKRFKRSIIEEHNIRFKTDLVIGEDFIFGLEYMLLSSSSAVVKNELYCVDETGTASITRAAKYDFMQFIRIYQHAFAIAECSRWSGEEKESLFGILDWLYCRTAFASTGHRMKAKKQAKLSIKELIMMFHQNLRKDIRPINVSHIVMRFCVRHKLIPVFMTIAWLHLAASRK